MSGEMIAIVAVGVALAGVILTSLKGTETRLGAQIKDLRGERMGAFGRAAGRIARGYHRTGGGQLRKEKPCPLTQSS